MLTTTLNKIRAHSPCNSGWTNLLKFLGKTSSDDEPLPFSKILESNGFYDAIWCCRSAPEFDKEWRTLAVWCARQVQHLMLDERSIKCLDVADAFIAGMAAEDEMAVAYAAARSAACDAAMSVAVATARLAAWTAVYDAAYAAQTKKFLEIVS